MQKRLKAKCQTIESKVDIIRNYWDKELAMMKFRAQLTGDSSMKKIVSMIEVVPVEIMDYVLLNFIRKCRQLHVMAFMQWRVHFS